MFKNPSHILTTIILSDCLKFLNLILKSSFDDDDIFKIFKM